jgi:flagellar protein FlgJ
MEINDVLLQQGINTPQINNKKDAELKKACKDFEALFVQKIFEEMKKSVPKNGFLGNSKEEEIYNGMYIEEISKEIAHGKGMGLGDELYKNLSQRLATQK